MAKQNVDYEVVILGGGLVGASLALSLQQAGKNVCLIETVKPNLNEDFLNENWDSRIYAVSPSNQAFLAKMDGWPEASRIGPVEKMDVFGDTGGNIQFDAEELNTGALAYIIENRYLQAKLWQRLQEEGVEIIEGKAVKLETNAKAASLTLQDGRTIETLLVVGADGANSWVRNQVNIPIKVNPYNHHGVVANFLCEKPHHGVAYQWFEEGEVLAYLPMAKQHMSIVWSTSNPQKLLSLNPNELAKTVAEKGKHVLGELTTITPAVAFELRLIRPKHTISERVVLVGDAAHTIHPLAGHGVNLGFGDVQELTGLLKSLKNSEDVGNWQLLRSYEQRRLESVRTMQFACDGLFKLFAAQNLPFLPKLRNIGLDLTNKITPLKKQMMKHAMGL